MLGIVVLVIIAVTVAWYYHHRNSRSSPAPPYRLGDMVKYNGTDLYGITRQYAKCHAEKIGGKYALSTSKRNDYALLASLAQEVCPPRAPDGIVIHIRLGDVLCDKNNTKHPHSAEAVAGVINDILPASSKPKILMCGIHNNKCVQESERYVETLRSKIPHTELRANADPDDDFCRLVNAEVFVAGRGGFSEMAIEVRKVLGRETILHPKLSGYMDNGVWYQHDPQLADTMNIKRS